MKTAAMERGKNSSRKNLETTAAAILENLGTCCEGTVFTFTSAGPNGGRQRLNKYRASLLRPHGGLRLREEPTDSVFTEMRMMPRSCETTPSNGVELWKAAKWPTSTVTEYESSRADGKVGDNDGDLRIHRIKRFETDRTGGYQNAKDELLKEPLKVDSQRKLSEIIVQEEPTARKNRRYVKCDNYRERQRYGEVGDLDDNKNCVWKEEKSGDSRASESLNREASYKCHKPVEDRRNKRDSCAEAIHVFEQRKVKCARRKEQDSCSDRYEALQIEGLSKLMADEELKKQRARHLTGGYMAEVSKNQREPLSESDDGEEDKSLNYSNQMSPGQFYHKMGHGRAEDTADLPLPPKFELASSAPMACSFISFKAGVPCIGNRRFHFADEASFRTTCSSNLENEGSGIHARHETQSQILQNNRPLKETSAEVLSIAPKRSPIATEVAFPSINADTEEEDDETESGAVKPQALDRLESAGRERSVDSDTEAAGDGLLIGNEVPRRQKPFNTSLMQHSRVIEKSSDREGGAISELRRSAQSKRENAGYTFISKDQHTNLDEGGYRNRGVNVHGHSAKKGREGLSSLADGLASRLLDWYGSAEVENDLEITGIDCGDDQSTERDGKDDFTLRTGMDGPSVSLVQAPQDLRAEIHEGLLNESEIHQMEQTKDSVSSDVPNKCLDDVNVEIRERLQSERDCNSVRKSWIQELEKLSLREVKTAIPKGKSATESRCTLRSEKIRTEVGDVGPSPRKSVPLRRQAWVKGFKKKSGEKVSYFERWLGRSKKDLGSMKLYKKSPSGKSGLKGGELSEAKETIELKHDHGLETLCSLGASLEQNLVPQAWSNSESQDYVMKEFEILEAVLQSHSTVNDRSEVAEYSQHSSIMYNEGTFDEKGEGWQDQGIMPEVSKSLVLDREDVTSRDPEVETDDKPVHWKSGARGDPNLQLEEQPQNDSFHQPFSGYDKRTYKSSDRLAPPGGYETSHVPNFTNSNRVQARECLQTMEEAEDSLADLPSISSTDDIDVVGERQCHRECTVRSKKDVKTGLETHKVEEMAMIPQCKDRLPLFLDTQGIGLAEQCGFLFQKRCSSQESRLVRTQHEVSTGEKPCPDLTMLNDSRDISNQNLLEARNAAVAEKSMSLRLGVLTMEISGITQLNSTGTQQSPPSDASGGPKSLDVVKSSVQIVNLEHSRTNRASAISFSQQLPSPVQEPKALDIFKDAKQVQGSSSKELEILSDVAEVENTVTCKFGVAADIGQLTPSARFEMPQSNRQQLIVGSSCSNSDSTFKQCNTPGITVAFGDSFTESETAVDSLDLEHCLSNLTSGSDFETHYRTCIEVPRAKEVSENENVKESSVNRRHKMPIIVRVRNRLASGWLLQHSLWKRVAKQKKTADCPVLTVKGFNQKERYSDPAISYSGQGSVVNPLKGVHQIKSAEVTDTASMQEKEQPSTTKLQKVILEEAGYGTNAGTENEKLLPGALIDVHVFDHHKLRCDTQNKPSASLEDGTVEQDQLQIGRVESNQAASQAHDMVEQDQMKMDDGQCEERSVISFAKWQSQALRMGKSRDLKDKVGEISVVDMDQNENEVAKLGKFSDFADDAELLSVVCLGNKTKEGPVSGEFSVFDDDDDGGEELPHVCLGKQERKPAELEKFSDFSRDRHTLENNSETKKSCHCQTDPHAEADVPRKEQMYVPIAPPVDLSIENCSTRETAKSELSQKSSSLHEYFSLDNLNKGLSICSAEILDHGGKGSLNTPAMMDMPAQPGDTLDEKPCLDCQRDNMYIIPQVEDVLQYLSVQPTLDRRAPPASHHYKSLVGVGEEEQHMSVPTFVQPFSHARIALPFCPPLQGPNFTSGNDKSVWGDGQHKEIDEKDQRRFSYQKRGIKETPITSECYQANGRFGDFKHWELMEMIKVLDNHQQTLPGHTPKSASNNDNHEHVYRLGKPKNAWDSYYHGDCDGTHGTVCWKGEPTQPNSNELSTEEQVFLERFSAISNDLKFCKLPEKTNGSSNYRSIGFESLGQPNRSSSPDLSTQTRLLSTTAGLHCGRQVSLSRGNRDERAPQQTYTQLTSLHPNFFNPLSLGEARRPDSTQDYQCEEYNRLEPHVLPDYASTFDCVSPSSSRNGSLDMSERHFNRTNTYTDCLNKYDHREAWDQGADGFHDWKASVPQGRFPSLTMHNSSFLAPYQNLLLNPRQSSCSSHTSQSTTPCQYDPCNHSCHFIPSLLLSCHHPPCNANMPHHNKCHFAEHSHPVPTSMTKPVMFQQTREPFLHGCSVQFAKTNRMHPYSPLQVTQPNESLRPWSHGHSLPPSLPHGHHKLAETKKGTHVYQDGEQSKSNSTNRKDHEKGLVWLSDEEMNLIWQLRSSGEKRELDAKWKRTAEQANISKADSGHKLVAAREKMRHLALAVCRHDAAACIQRNWRKYIEKKTENIKLDNGQRPTTMSLLTTDPVWDNHLQYCKLRQAAISLQLCGPSPKELGHGNLVKRWYTTMQKAARIIQQAWRSAIKRKKKLPPATGWPKDLKKFYDMVKSRHTSGGLHAPSFELFAKSVEQIQAATEGARVRRRLKSHRLQTIIMEIKEIRMLLSEMSQEAKCDSTTFLFPQLCTQLQKKTFQLHTALNGQQMEARFLLRRCPATPLLIHPSRSTSPKRLVMVPSQKSGGQALTKLSSNPAKAKRFYNPPLTNPASTVSENRIAQSYTFPRQAAVPEEKNVVHTQDSVSILEGSKGKAVPLWNSSPDPSDSMDPPDSAKLLSWYFLAQRSPSKCTGGQGTPIDFCGGQAEHIKKEFAEKLDTGQIKPAPSLPSQNASLKLKYPEYIMSKSFDEQPLPVPQRRKTTEMSLEEMAVGGSNAGMYMTEYAPSTDMSDKPKRPFLKRKSVVMPSQKLDWSKVKPMVSSRLEPELKTKLSFCKGPTKEPTRTNSKKKKANYSKVKSRLFSYEENVSPSGGEDGTVLHTHTTEVSEAENPQVLRGLARGSSIQGTENGRNSRPFLDRQRAASPDLMRLRCMAAADRDCSQSSMLETQSVATYSSRFNSARYLHKLGNSEQASKGTLVGSCQQRTQRIRLRILPRSQENEVGGLFVQEINLQEEMQEIWEDQRHTADGKGKRQQSHSHRYAIYRESPERNAQPSTRVDETARPSSPKDSKRVTSTSSDEETRDPLRQEFYKYLESK